MSDVPMNSAAVAAPGVAAPRWLGAALPLALLIVLAVFPPIASALGLDFYIGFVRRVLVVALAGIPSMAELPDGPVIIATFMSGPFMATGMFGR